MFMPLSFSSKRLVAGLAILFFCGLSACSDRADDAGAVIDAALEKIGKQRDDLSTPRFGQRYRDPGRFSAVEWFMTDMTRVPGFAAALSGWSDTGRVSQLVSDITTGLAGENGLLREYPAQSGSVSGDSPSLPVTDVPDFLAALATRPVLESVLGRLAAHADSLRRDFLALDETQRKRIGLQLEALVASRVDSGTGRWLASEELQAFGADYPVDAVASQSRDLLAFIESNLEVLLQETGSLAGSEWDTPYGKVAIAGHEANRHHGAYLLLIDAGGDDDYDALVQPPVPGNVSLVIDVEGDDHVSWQSVAGPGAGILGSGIWLDLAGNDHYEGANFGLGASLFGSGILIDYQGDDRYSTGSTSLGAAYFGLAVMADLAGNDSYASESNSQGYGGSGGLGIQADYAGDDQYDCGHVLRDSGVKRRKRHDEAHYISMCQGYGFGIRQKYSGGIGLLLDGSGNDTYTTDLFGQGGAYWYAIGMLFDYAGDDQYQCFEHGQGESLHAGGGFLVEFSGNDMYTGHEHVQGLGLDHAAGLLYDLKGNDTYRAYTQSQGAGVDAYGIGILLDRDGADSYAAGSGSQGYVLGREESVPGAGRIGLLLDLAGEDRFVQPGVPLPGPAGRVINRTGLAIDY